jgi:hypothetical protein
MKYLKMLGLAAVAAMALLAFLGASSASATTLESNGTPFNGAVSLVFSIEPETKAVLKDSAGTTTDECPTSEVKGTTEKDEEGKGDFTGPTVGGKVSSLTFVNCTHTTTVIKSGSLSISWIENTTDGTVFSSGAEVTVVSTAFGASAVCKTGSGTDIGTLTGATNGTTNKTNTATMDINGKISCGILGTSTWTGSYIITSPKPSETELAVTK